MSAHAPRMVKAACFAGDTPRTLALAVIYALESRMRPLS